MKKQISGRLFENSNIRNSDQKTGGYYHGHPYSNNVFPKFQCENRLNSNHLQVEKDTQNERFFYEIFVKFFTFGSGDLFCGI